MNSTQAARPKTYKRADIRFSEVKEKRVDGFQRPVSYIRAFGVKNDQEGHDFGTFFTTVR